MRVTSMAAGLAVLLAACGGGEQKAENQQSTATPESAPAAAPAAAPSATGATHDVNMVLEGSTYKYVPDNLTIKAGDAAKTTTEVKTTQAMLDRAATKGYIHPNKAARLKSRLVKRVRAATAKADEKK